MSQRLAKFAELDLAVLFGLRLQRFGITALTVLDLTPTLAIFRSKMIAQDGEQPSRHIGARLEGIDIGECPQQRLLHEVVGPVHVPAQRDREGAEARHRGKDGFANRLVHGHYCLSLSLPSMRLTNSAKRSGTPWFSTSSYMARNCCPSRACTSRVSFAGLVLFFFMRVAADSICVCCPGGLLASFMVDPACPGPIP